MLVTFALSALRAASLLTCESDPHVFTAVAAASARELMFSEGSPQLPH